MTTTTKDWHYSLDNIDKENALINIIYGERSGGKSYQLKHKKAIIPYLESIIKDSINRDRFILLRRFSEEIKKDKVSTYFKDVDIRKLTNGKWDSVIVESKMFYLSRLEDNGKRVKGDLIGYIASLNTEQHYAGGSYLDVTNIIFEEFISRTQYLADEPSKLMNFWNTVDRKRGLVRLWLAGNSISRVCPYFVDWDLMEKIKTQEQGTIITTFVDTETEDDLGVPIKVKMAIEYCKKTGKSSYSIGKHKDMLNKGLWQTDPQPKLARSYKEYSLLYRLGFDYKEFKFIGELLKDSITSDIVWFIYPYEKEFKSDLLVISDKVKTDIHYQRNIYDVSIKNERLKEILSTFRENNIFYSSDLAGTDFKQVIDFSIRK